MDRYVERIWRKVQLFRDYLYKTVEKYTGLSLYEYSTKFTMEKAGNFFWILTLQWRKLWNGLDLAIGHNFTDFFKKNYGMTPREYRKSQFH